MALLVLVMGLSLAFIPMVLFPVLRRVNEVLAVGYPAPASSPRWTAIWGLAAIPPYVGGPPVDGKEPR